MLLSNLNRDIRVMDPAQVASSVIAAWMASAGAEADEDLCEALPERATLERLLATAFTASLLREENRPLTFRLMLRGPERFRQAAGPPEGLYRLLFDEPRPFTAHELRQLAPAVDYDRSLIGVCLDEKNELQIWGIVQSGPRWLEQFRGGRGNASNLPDCLIVGVRDPGHLIISQGDRSLCALEAGQLQSTALNVFKSEWLSASFATVRQELLELHAAAKARSAHPWTNIAPGLTRMVGQQMIQRLISTVQRARHGGTLLIVPTETAEEWTHPNPLVRLKYRFAEEEPRARFRSLIVRVMNTLASTVRPTGGGPVGWDEYGRATSRELGSLDEAIFEMSHFIATLTAVDGAVVVTKRFDLLGFGGEIAGSLPEVPSVARALDLEGDSYRMEASDDFGTRHRSVFRLCNALGDVLGIVVSQDGGARFVRWKDPHVMYWNHSAIAPQ